MTTILQEGQFHTVGEIEDLYAVDLDLLKKTDNDDLKESIKLRQLIPDSEHVPR